MLEKDIEQYLVREVHKRGGLTYKFVSPAARGVPDRIVIIPGGAVWFVELKTETGRLSPLQRRHLKQLRQVGANATVVYGMDGVQQFLRGAVDDGV
jgi:hypothetical protein